jgi:predicted anti-sigma-YlaC factor YlaD
MNCIHDEIIQKYIDGETNPEEVSLVENHIATCKKCALKVGNQRRLAASIKEAINLLAKDSVEIPEFTNPSGPVKKPSLTIKRFSYVIAAACILLFVIVITDRKEMNSQVEITPDTDFAMDIDANRSISQFPLVINIIDAEGNIYEYSIK